VSSDVGTVRELLRERAADSPTAPAVLRGDGTVVATYADLVARTDEIGHCLRRIGVGPGDAVFVAIPAGPEMLVAILGAMCCAVCVPINPAYTPIELEHLASDIRPRAALTLDGSGGSLGEFAGAHGLDQLRLRQGARLADPPAAATGDAIGDAEPASTALMLHTAGTTARPKQVPLTHRNLIAAAANVVASLQLQDGDRCLNVMPLFHSHGLLGAALSTISSGGAVACTDAFDPRRFTAWASACGATWYTAAPTIHHLVLDAPGHWRGFRLMRSASAPLAPLLAERLEERFSAPMIEVYGMTEAYQIAANPLPPGERRLGTVGVPTGTEIAIMDEAGQHLPAGHDGEVVVRGPAVFAGYSAPAGVNEQAFFGDWFRTGDVGRLAEDGCLTITGRIKEQINRGGEKISPREVDEAVLAHPDVRAAMAFAVPDEQLGEEVGVAIVAADGTNPDIASVRRFLHGSIAAHKIPRYLVRVDALPKSSTGKLLRLDFAAAHAEQLATRATHIEPTTDDEVPDAVADTVLDRLARQWAAVLDLDRMPGPDERFFDLGGTSLLTMELVTRIDAEFGVDLPVVEVVDVPSLGDMAARIDALIAGAVSTTLLRRYRIGTNGQRLVLVPGQYGMALGLHLIADRIDADVDVYLFDYPGNRPGEVALRTVEELAERLVDELRDADAVERTALYGNSMGSWVVFEAARRMDALGHRPLFVGIGDMYSPIYNVDKAGSRPPLPVLVRNRMRRAYRRLRSRWARRRSANREGAAVTRQRAVYEASEGARRRYRPKPYAGDLLVIAADERDGRFGATLGWERHTTGSIATRRVPGGHADMHHAQAARIADALTEQLDRSPTSTQSSERTPSEHRADGGLTAPAND
jgi:oxalate---CoA ligase